MFEESVFDGEVVLIEDVQQHSNGHSATGERGHEQIVSITTLSSAFAHRCTEQPRVSDTTRMLYNYNIDPLSAARKTTANSGASSGTSHLKLAVRHRVGISTTTSMR